MFVIKIYWLIIIYYENVIFYLVYGILKNLTDINYFLIETNKTIKSNCYEFDANYKNLNFIFKFQTISI